MLLSLLLLLLSVFHLCFLDTDPDNDKKTYRTVYVYQSQSVMQQIIIIFLPLSLKTQHVSALNGHLQVSQYAETATLH
jgi:hypothetical protein